MWETDTGSSVGSQTPNISVGMLEIDRGKERREPGCPEPSTGVCDLLRGFEKWEDISQKCVCSLKFSPMIWGKGSMERGLDLGVLGARETKGVLCISSQVKTGYLSSPNDISST